jgi:DNA-binding sugar fermentation-stimulating protein
VCEKHFGVLANKAMLYYLQYRKRELYGEGSVIFAERYINDYKVDLYVKSPTQNRIIEIKSVLSLDGVGVFPTVFSERANTQLDWLEKLIPQTSENIVS